jgi:hypothetical protein
MNTKRLFIRGLSGVLLTLFILSSTHAEIPFTEAFGMYQKTKRDAEKFSPFWAMAAIHGKLLERIRFFGFYTKTASGYDKALGEDKIAELLLALFPSQDGIQFVPNAQDEHFKNLSKPENLKYINDIIEILLQRASKAIKTTKIRDIIKILTTSSTARSKVPVLLVSAYEQQAEYANPSNPTQQRYPENIVVISLLSFLMKVADNTTFKLSKTLPLLMDGGYVPPTDINKGFYERYKGNFPDIIREFGTSSVRPQDLEMAFFLAKGFDMYENLVPEPVKYSQNITITGGPEAFSDCGETSLRNFFMLLLSAGNGGSASMEKMRTLEDKVYRNRIASINNESDFNHYEPYQRFKAFIINHPNIIDGTSRETHSAWAEIVSDLNVNSPALGINRVQYGRKKTGAIVEGYEIKSNFLSAQAISIFNMFNVLARILPDKTLNEPWSLNKSEQYKEATKKLDHLCSLFSKDDMLIDWKNELTNSKVINSDFMSIVFTIQDSGTEVQDAFKWIFQKGHFDIERISTVKDDWRARFANVNYQNDWLASIFTNSLTNKIREEKYGELRFPLTAIYNASLTTLEGIRETIRIVLNGRLEKFYPLINRWVQQSISTHSENPNFLVEIVEFIATLPSSSIEAEHKQQIIKDAIDIAKIKVLLQTNIALSAFKTSKYKAAEELIKGGAIIDEHDEQGNTLFHLAVEQRKVEIIDSLIGKGADADKANKDNRTPLNLAIAKSDAESPESLKVIRKLIHATKNIDVQNQHGNTLLHLAIAQNKMEIFRILLREAKPNINLSNKAGQTPLALAKDNNKETAVEILRRLGADE